VVVSVLPFSSSVAALIQQPRTAVAGIADATRDTGESNFQCGSERVRQDDGRLEASPELARDAKTFSSGVISMMSSTSSVARQRSASLAE
jgi:hypothetical protein